MDILIHASINFSWDNMRRILVYPYYLKSLISLITDPGIQIDSSKKISIIAEKITREKYDMYIFSSKKALELTRGNTLFGESNRVVLLLEESLGRGYKPLSINNKILSEGFIIDPDAFYITLSIVAEYLIKVLGLNEKQLIERIRILSKLYDQVIEKSKKILRSNRDQKVIPLTSIEYYIAKAININTSKILYNIDDCERFLYKDSELETLIREGVVIATKQSIGELSDRCGEKFLEDYELFKDLVLVIDTSLNCHIIAPVIVATYLQTISLAKKTL